MAAVGRGQYPSRVASLQQGNTLPTPASSHLHHTAPRFGSFFSLPVISSVVTLVGKMQQNPVAELIATDVVGMVLPRTYLEWKERGTDMGIETFIREASGTVSIVFLSSWLATLNMGIANQLAKSREKRALAQGVPRINWRHSHIAGPTLAMLGNQFNVALQNSQGKSVEHLKAHFFDSVLQRLQSNSINLADQLITGIEGNTLNPAQRIDHVAMAKGVLTPTQRHHLVDLLVSTSQHPNQPATRQARKKALNQAIDFAVGHQSHLTETATIWLDPKANKAIRGKNVGILLNDTLNFWQQYVDDIALKESSNHLDHDKNISAKFINGVSERLMGKASTHKPGLWQRLFPNIKQGVLPYVLNKRNFHVAIPFSLSIALSVGVAFFNNWLTKRRHHGVVHFPGLGSPEDQTKQAKQPDIQPAATATEGRPTS